MVLFGNVLNRDELKAALKKAADFSTQYNNRSKVRSAPALTLDQAIGFTVLSPLGADRIFEHFSLGFGFSEIPLKDGRRYEDRIKNQATLIRKSLIHYLGRKKGKLESFDDFARLLEVL